MKRDHSIPYRSRVSSVKYQGRENLAARGRSAIFLLGWIFDADFGFGRQTACFQPLIHARNGPPVRHEHQARFSGGLQSLKMGVNQ